MFIAYLTQHSWYEASENSKTNRAYFTKLYQHSENLS
jgi:hypothetical protein